MAMIEVVLRIPNHQVEARVRVPDDVPVRELIRGVLSQMPNAPALDDPNYNTRLKRAKGGSFVQLENGMSLREQGVHEGDTLLLDIEFISAARRADRLRNEQSELLAFAFSPFVRVKPTRGAPPEEYEVEYVDVAGLARSAQTISERRQHRIRIQVPGSYPNEKPSCTFLTPMFHPNVKESGGTICIGEWRFQRTLKGILIQVGKMIQWEMVNPGNPFNTDAAQYAREHHHRLPLDDVDFELGIRRPATILAPAYRFTF